MKGWGEGCRFKPNKGVLYKLQSKTKYWTVLMTLDLNFLHTFLSCSSTLSFRIFWSSFSNSAVSSSSLHAHTWDSWGGKNANKPSLWSLRINRTYLSRPHATNFLMDKDRPVARCALSKEHHRATSQSPCMLSGQWAASLRKGYTTVLSLSLSGQ